MKRLLESDLKVLTIKELIARDIINEDSLIMSELVVGQFTRRADLVVLSSGKLIAFEIKSEADSLSRLDGQVETYLKYFDKVIVVADSKFVPQLFRRMRPEIGIWEAKGNSIEIKKRGRFQSKVKKSSLLDFLDVVDLIKFANKSNRRSSKHRSELELSAINLPKTTIKKAVLYSLNRKFRRSTERFFCHIKNREVATEDLKLLSRFQEQRDIADKSKKLNYAFWNNLDEHLKSLKSFSENF